MVDAAKLAGVDAIKFQTFKTEDLVIKLAPKANYQRKNSFNISQFNMLKSLELSETDFRNLSGYCKKNRIIFLSTPFDSRSAEFLFELGVKAFKISSGDLNNLPLLLQVAGYKRPVILSTGMSDLNEVKESVTAVHSTGNIELILLHCTSNYPAKYENLNLDAINTLRERFNVIVGYSDHTLGIEASIAAVAMGANVIEKHFTLDRLLPGPDHGASLEPDEFKNMVQSIRNIEKAIGDGIKVVQRSEIEIKKVARKSIVAKYGIQKGKAVTLAMLAIKRPGTGIGPFELRNVIGKTAKINIKKDQILNWKDIE
jgi:N-acetylneuraminate synthase/N,N'-diacetyllegionaminate synthase